MLSAEACERFVGARSSEEIIASLGEFGCRTVSTTGADGDRVDREASLMTMLVDAFREVKEMLPTPDAVAFLQYKYDCNNIKSLLKCRVRGVEPTGMLSDAGSVSVAALREAVETGEFSVLPCNMAAAAGEAYKNCLRTADTQSIDLTLDRACFSDMAKTAAASGVPFARRYVATLTDLTNLVMTLRVIRMGGNAEGSANGTDSGSRLLEAALLPGGNVEAKVWLDLLGKGEEAVWSFVRKGELAPVARTCGVGTPLSTVERATDAHMMTLAREARWLPFGAELAVAYLVGLEIGIKNLRIIMAGKDAHNDAAAIRERLREMYV